MDKLSDEQVREWSRPHASYANVKLSVTVGADELSSMARELLQARDVLRSVAGVVFRKRQLGYANVLEVACDVLRAAGYAPEGES